jgi:hypothetical protein
MYSNMTASDHSLQIGARRKSLHRRNTLKESYVASVTIRNAGEFNGFLKPKVRLFVEPLQFADGKLVLPVGYTPAIDRAILTDRAAPTSSIFAPLASSLIATKCRPTTRLLRLANRSFHDCPSHDQRVCHSPLMFASRIMI